MNSTANIGIWLNRLDVLLNDDVNVCGARTFLVWNTIAWQFAIPFFCLSWVSCLLCASYAYGLQGSFETCEHLWGAGQISLCWHWLALLHLIKRTAWNACFFLAWLWDMFQGARKGALRFILNRLMKMFQWIFFCFHSVWACDLYLLCGIQSLTIWTSQQLP